MPEFDLRLVFSSVPAIVGVVILIVNRAKVWLSGTPLSVVPLWALACTLSGGLTLLGWYMGTLPGDDPFALVQRAVVLAAASSGFREWFAAGLSKPLSASSAAIEAQQTRRGI